MIHDHPQFLVLRRTLRIALVFTSTEAFWPNLTEPHFGLLGRATVAGNEDRDHAVRRPRIHRYCAWGIVSSAAQPTRSRLIRAVKPA